MTNRQDGKTLNAVATMGDPCGPHDTYMGGGGTRVGFDRVDISAGDSKGWQLAEKVLQSGVAPVSNR